MVSAALLTAVPEVSAVATSVPPAVVPIEVETAPVNVGVMATVAPKRGEVVERLTLAVGVTTTVTVVEANLERSSLDVAVMMTLLFAVAGAVQTPVEVIVPAVAVQVRPSVTPPEAVVEKVVEVLTVRVMAEGEIALTTTVCGVTVTEASATSPATLTT